MKTYLTRPLSELIKLSEKYAMSMLEEDLKWNLAIGRNGVGLFKKTKEISILTHCNTGPLQREDMERQSVLSAPFEMKVLKSLSTQTKHVPINRVHLTCMGNARGKKFPAILLLRECLPGYFKIEK